MEEEALRGKIELMPAHECRGYSFDEVLRIINEVQQLKNEGFNADAKKGHRFACIQMRYLLTHPEEIESKDTPLKLDKE